MAWAKGGHPKTGGWLSALDGASIRHGFLMEIRARAIESRSRKRRGPSDKMWRVSSLMVEDFEIGAEGRVPAAGSFKIRLRSLVGDVTRRQGGRGGGNKKKWWERGMDRGKRGGWRRCIESRQSGVGWEEVCVKMYSKSQ